MLNMLEIVAVWQNRPIKQIKINGQKANITWLVRHALDSRDQHRICHAVSAPPWWWQSGDRLARERRLAVVPMTLESILEEEKRSKYSQFTYQ
jgi:hypothetical protein